LVIRVQTRDNEPVDKALRRLRKLCNNEGLTRVTKSKAYFEKPSERRRREARERLKSIRLACRAKENDAQKLMNRRRKARKTARGGPRGDREGAPGEMEPRGGMGPREPRGDRGRGPRPASAAPAPRRPVGDAPAPA
jgi:small subunit ribosomal protein S21